MVPSSGSVTVTVNGIGSPKLNSCAVGGQLSVTVGAVLPTVISDARACRSGRCGSVTVSVGV